MRIEKLPVNSHRLRRIPPGFGWVDHRLVKNRLMRNCSTDSLALYLVLVCVSDQDGLSYYGNALLGSILGWTHGRLEKARSCLVQADLIAWGEPLYQVLEVPDENGEVCHD